MKIKNINMLVLLLFNLVSIDLYHNIAIAIPLSPNYNTLQIAITAPFSGKDKIYGNMIWQGATEAVEDINQIGGIYGIKLKLIKIDDQCDPILAQTIAKHLSKDSNIIAVIGHVCYQNNHKNLDSYALSGKLFITPSSTQPDLSSKGVNTFFRNCGRDDSQADTIINFLDQKLKSKKIALLHSNELDNKNFAKLLRSRIQDTKMNIEIDHIFNQEQIEFPTLINQLKKAKIDVILFTGHYLDMATLTRELHNTKLSLPIIGTQKISNSYFIRASGGYNNTTSVITSRLDINHQNLPNKFKNYDLISFQSYASIQILYKALLMSKDYSGKSLSNWLHNNYVDTVIGKLAWDTNGDLNKEYAMYIWDKDGNLITL